MRIYMAVTSDELELPLFVTDKAVELAKKFNIKPKTLSASIFHNRSGKRQGYKFITVELGKEE